MNATKRKFNALLSGIGNKPTTSSSSKEVNNGTREDPDSQIKKRRIAPLSSSSTHRSSLLKSTTESAAIPHKKSASLAVEAGTPKYAPWDRGEFLKRLKSFSNLTDWTPKPARVNEVEWAKRGWVCRKFERVRCSLCNVEIIVKLNRKEVDGKEEPVYVAHNIEDALVDKYVDLIVTSHDEDCLWRKRGCDDSIFKLPLNHAPTTFQTLHERYDELCARKDTLPYTFNIRTPSDFDLDLILSYLPRDFFTAPPLQSSPAENPSPANINKVAFQMALFGWQGHVHDRLGVQLGSVSCHACFRVLGLWLFKSKSVNEAGQEIDGPVVDCLNVATEHRDYCPWRNPSSQNGQKATAKSSSSAMAGWEIVLRVLKNEYQLSHKGDSQVEKDTKPATAVASIIESGADVEDEDMQSIREEKDRERWVRLRRVKSLFDTKSRKKLHRMVGATDVKGKSTS